MEINITEVCGDDVISRDSGRKVRDLILAHWNEPQIRLLFSGRTVGSVSFFDEAIGLLLKRGNKTPDELKNKLVFPDLKAADRMLLNYVVATRVKESAKL